MYTLDRPRPTNEFVGVDGLCVDGVSDRMNDSQRIRWPWSKFAVRAVNSEHIKGSWLAGVDKCVLGVQPWPPTLHLVPLLLSTPWLHSHFHVVSCCVATCTMEWSNTVSLRLRDLYREKELLWNPTHADYKSNLKRLDAWNEISQLLGCDQT
jgi:hypothetical protein